MVGTQLASVTHTTDTLRVVLHPVVPLASLATVHVRVLAQTVGGAASLDEVYSFVVKASPTVSASSSAPSSST